MTACDRVTIDGRALSTPGRESWSNRPASDREPRGSRSRSAIAVACCLGSEANASPRDQADAITLGSARARLRQSRRAHQGSLEASPNDPQIWTLQAIALSRKGDTSGALTAYRRALTLSPDYIPALEGRHSCNTRPAAATPCRCSHLLQLRPTDPTAHAMLAVLDYREGKCETAVGHFEKTGTLLDSELDALARLRHVPGQTERRDEAIAVFQRAVALPQRRPRAPAARLHSADGLETARRNRHTEPQSLKVEQLIRRRWSSPPAPTRMPATLRTL